MIKIQRVYLHPRASKLHIWTSNFNIIKSVYLAQMHYSKHLKNTFILDMHFRHDRPRMKVCNSNTPFFASKWSNLDCLRCLGIKLHVNLHSYMFKEHYLGLYMPKDAYDWFQPYTYDAWRLKMGLWDLSFHGCLQDYIWASTSIKDIH